MTSTSVSELGRAGQLVAGKFRLDAMIGQGGMGSVWSATHLGLGHRVAVKLIAREFVRSPEALRRFDAEAKAAARLQSRHVVQVFDNGTLEDGTPYIAMELLSGENLSDRIAKVGPFGLAHAVDVLAQCCKALGRAHAAGIVHRDIKPDNIFLALEPDADRDVVKILDFGVAKVALGLESGSNNSHATGTGTLLGTPLFMSPEQIRGSREVDQRTDLYSLGLVAYTMLTGQLAVAGDTFGDILIKVCTQPLPRLRAAAPSLPRPLEAWFQRTCAREPGDRCQSAQEFIDSLRAAAGDPPAHANPLPQTPALPPLQSARGNQAAVPAFGQSAAAVSVTAAGVPKRPMGAVVAGAILAVLFAAGGAVLLAFSPTHHDPHPAANSIAAARSTPLLAPEPAAASVVLAQPATTPLAARDAGSSSASALPPRVRAPEVTTPQPRPFVPTASPAFPATATTAMRPVATPLSMPRSTAPINVGY